MQQVSQFYQNYNSILYSGFGILTKAIKTLFEDFPEVFYYWSSSLEPFLYFCYPSCSPPVFCHVKVLVQFSFPLNLDHRCYKIIDKITSSLCNLVNNFQLNVRKTYSEYYQTSKLEPLAKTVNGFKSLPIFSKSSILNDSHSSEYASVADMKKWD